MKRKKIIRQTSWVMREKMTNEFLIKKHTNNHQRHIKYYSKERLNKMSVRKLSHLYVIMQRRYRFKRDEFEELIGLCKILNRRLSLAEAKLYDVLGNLSHKRSFAYLWRESIHQKGTVKCENCEKMEKRYKDRIKKLSKELVRK